MNDNFKNEQKSIIENNTNEMGRSQTLNERNEKSPRCPSLVVSALNIYLSITPHRSR